MNNDGIDTPPVNNEPISPVHEPLERRQMSTDMNNNGVLDKKELSVKEMFHHTFLM